MANAMLGEIMPSMAEALASSETGFLLIPMSRCNTRGVGMENQRPRCKQRGINLAALQSSGVFDPRGIRKAN